MDKTVANQMPNVVAKNEEQPSPYHPPNLSLKLVQIVCRHGERAPIYSDTTKILTTGDYSNDCLESVPSIIISNSQQIHQPQNTFHVINEINPFSCYIPCVSDHTKSGLIGNHPQKNENLGKSHIGACFTGQLSDKGRSTMRSFGKSVRQLYVNQLKFLPKNWNSKTQEVTYLRSTHFTRTIESLNSFLNGLYPKSTRIPSYSAPVIHFRAVDNEDNMVIPLNCSLLNTIREKFEEAYFNSIRNFNNSKSKSKNSDKKKKKETSPIHKKSASQKVKNSINQDTRDVFDERKKFLDNSKGQPLMKHISKQFDCAASALAHGKKINMNSSEFANLSEIMSKMWFGLLRRGGNQQIYENIGLYSTKFNKNLEYPDVLVSRLMGGRFGHEILELMEDHVEINLRSNEINNNHQKRITKPLYSTHNVPFASTILLSKDQIHNNNNKLSLKEEEQNLAQEILPRFAYYSGHDSTIAPLLGGLGLWQDEWPFFASNITFELYVKNKHASKNNEILSASSSIAGKEESELDTHFVRVKYDTKAEKLPACAATNNHFPGDPTLCTYSAFISLMRDFVISEKQLEQVCVETNKNN